MRYRVMGEGDLPRLELRPAMNFRHYEDPVDVLPEMPYEIRALADRYGDPRSHQSPSCLRMQMSDCSCDFPVDPRQIHEVVYRTELERGYDSEGGLWSPGIFRAQLSHGQTVTLIGSTEEWNIIEVLSPTQVAIAENDRRTRLLDQSACDADDRVAAELVFAADQFVISPAGRAEEGARAHAFGDEVRTVIAGYHWFTRLGPGHDD